MAGGLGQREARFAARGRLGDPPPGPGGWDTPPAADLRPRGCGPAPPSPPGAPLPAGDLHSGRWERRAGWGLRTLGSWAGGEGGEPPAAPPAEPYREALPGDGGVRGALRGADGSGPDARGGGHGGDEGGAREGPWAWDLHAGRWEARAMGPDPGLAPGRHAGRWEGRAGHPRPGASEARPTAPDLHASGFDRNGRRHEGRWQERASVAYDLPNRPLGGGQPQDGRRRCGAPNEVKMHAGGWEARARVAHEREHPKPSGASCAGLWEDRARYGKEAPAPPREFGRAGRWEARAEWVGARRGTPQQEAARAAARARGEADWETTQPILGNTPASNLPNSAGGRGREPPREAARRKAKEADAVRGPRQTLPEGGTGGWLGRIADHGTHRPPLRMGT